MFTPKAVESKIESNTIRIHLKSPVNVCLYFHNFRK